MKTKKHTQFLKSLSSRVKSQKNKNGMLIELQHLHHAIQLLKEQLQK